MKAEALIPGFIGLIIGGLITLFFLGSQLNTSKVPVAQPSPAIVMNHGTSMTDMVSNLKGKTGNEFDKEFIKGMIEHHEGAIDMAKEAKINAGHDEIKDMAGDIISAQTKEIDQMKKWETEWNLK